MSGFEHIPYDQVGRFRAPAKLIETAEQAAEHNDLNISAYYRRCVVRQLEVDGFDLGIQAVAS